MVRSRTVFDAAAADPVDFGRRYWRSAPRAPGRLPALSPASIDDATFRLLADNLPTLCWVANGDGYIVWYNRRWHEYCGTTPEQMEGWGWQSVHDPAMLTGVMERWTASIASGQPFEMTFPLKGADGMFRPFLTRIQPVRDASGEVARWFGVNTEILDQVTAESALRAEHDRTRGVLEGMAEGFLLLDRDFRVLDINAEALRLDRRPREAVVGTTYWQAWPGTEEAEKGRLFKRAMSERTAVSAEVRQHDAWVEVRAYPHPEGLAIFCRDVSDRKRAESRLEEESARHDASAAERAAILGQLAEGVIVTDPDGRIIFVNEAAERLHGVKRLDVTPDDYTDAYHLLTEAGEPYAPHELPLTRAVRGETVTDARWRIRRPDGTEVLAIGSAYPIVDGTGRRRGAALTLRDDTERSRAEAALRESRDRLASESHMLEVLNRTGTHVASELRLHALVQRVVDAGVELTGAQFGAFFYNVLDDRGESYMLYALSGVERSAFEGFGMPRATSVFAPTFRGERVIRSGDIRKDERYGKNAPHSGLPTGHLPVRSYLAVPVAARSGEVIGGLFFGHEQPDLFSERCERVMTGLAAQAAIAIDNSRLFEAVQRANAELEQRVRERTAERDRVWNVSRDLFVICGFDGNYRNANPAWADQLGYGEDELIGMRFDALVHPDDKAATRSEFERLIRGTVIRDFDIRLRSRSGSYRWYSWTCIPEDGSFYAAGREITARKELEEQLRQSQKMEAVGQLTGGIAHDFNNLLTVVIGNVDMARRALTAGMNSRASRAMDNAQKGAERAAALTQRLLAFSRRQPLAPEPVKVDKLVAGMADLVHRALGETVDLEMVTGPGLWRVEVDPNQLEAAILNLAVNARDAMPEGGKLTIETSNARLDERVSTANGEVAPGNYVVVAVTDTGTGMSKETLARAFEPFFTTKEVGKGTGLGLSQVYGFVKQSGGDVKLYSQASEGTIVKLYLPRLMSGAGDDAELEQAVDAGRYEDIVLVVEDDDDVRAYTVEILRELNYRVLEAHDGASALRLLERQPTPVDLLFTDVVMPGMSGRELAEEARRRQPDLKVLYTSGYSRNAIVRGGRLDTGIEMIAKPFTYQALAARISDVLEAGRSGGVPVDDDARARPFAVGGPAA